MGPVDNDVSVRAPGRYRMNVAELREIGLRSGLTAVGVAPADPMTRARQLLHERKAGGLHGGMSFTYKNPDRSTDPRATFPWAQSLVVGAYRYWTPEPPRPDEPHGRVARYAVNEPYRELERGLRAIAARLVRSRYKASIVVDQNHLVDREAAWLAGIGWFGKNANILLPGQGSWIVLGAVVTDAELDVASPVVDGCGSCRRCIDGCPTGAIVAPGTVDARRCLAWLVQAPGVFPVEFRVALGDRLYGCDDCQEVCPPNHRVERAAGSAVGDSPWVDLIELLSSTDDELLARHGRWYIAERHPRTLRRNALIVLGNTADGNADAVVAALRHALRHDDEIVRAHAVWAAARLGRHDLLAAVVDDPSPLVGVELAGVNR